MTDQMEPVDDATQYRRKIDDSLARFSAAHDELAEEEARRKQRMSRLLESTRTKLQRVVHGGDQSRTELPEQPPADAEPEPVGPSTQLSPANAIESPLEAEAEPDTEADPTPRTRLQEKKQRRTDRSTRIIRVSAAIIAALVFLVTGVAWGAKTWFNGKFNEVAALDENSSDIKNAAGQRGDENFLIAGSDTRAGADSEMGAGTADTVEGARSDSLMVAHVPADRQRAVVVGFPRDLEVNLPECERWDSGSGQYTKEMLPAKPQSKLNEAFARGGPRCTTKLVQQLTGLRINHFVGVDFQGFKGMIDAVQGVPLHVDKPVVDDVLGTVIPKPGDVNISGDEALNFVRARHVAGDPTSDYGRIKRQQQVVSALLKKTMSPDVLLNAGKLTGLVNAFAGATFGDNIGVDQLLTLAQSMQGLDPNKVTFVTIPTVGESNSRGNEVLLQEKTGAMFRALIDNTPLPAEDAATTGSTGTQPPAPPAASPPRRR